jgi:hypothetical protein
MLPGDCVLTTYGVAVVTHLCADSHDGSLFCARLWRIPGKSIASSSYAYLRKDSVSSFLSFLSFYVLPSPCMLPKLLKVHHGLKNKKKAFPKSQEFLFMPHIYLSFLC